MFRIEVIAERDPDFVVIEIQRVAEEKHSIFVGFPVKTELPWITLGSQVWWLSQSRLGCRTLFRMFCYRPLSQ